MQSAERIRQAIAQVSLQRQACADQPALAQAVLQVKRFQSQRFAGTYADLLASPQHRMAARFFLDELYSDKDYTERDAQFVRISGPMQTFFPAQVVATAVALAQLHALSEQLDHAMGVSWLAHPQGDHARRYVQAWRNVGQRDQRQAQLTDVMQIGRDMTRLTRTPGLRLMLKMMRGPAAAAGLGSLQRFLESGFDTFAQMSSQAGGVESFLSTIAQREEALITQLFEADFVACETALNQVLVRP